MLLAQSRIQEHIKYGKLWVELLLYLHVLPSVNRSCNINCIYKDNAGLVL